MNNQDSPCRRGTDGEHVSRRQKAHGRQGGAGDAEGQAGPINPASRSGVPRRPRGCSARPSAMMTTGRPAAVGPPPSDVANAASSLATASQASWRSSARPWRRPKQRGLRRRTTRGLHRGSHGYSSAARIASRPSVSAAGPGCRISGDLISNPVRGNGRDLIPTGTGPDAIRHDLLAAPRGEDHVRAGRRDGVRGDDPVLGRGRPHEDGSRRRCRRRSRSARKPSRSRRSAVRPTPRRRRAGGLRFCCSRAIASRRRARESASVLVAARRSISAPRVRIIARMPAT
jgi:hypothetical protein